MSASNIIISIQLCTMFVKYSQDNNYISTGYIRLFFNILIFILKCPWIIKMINCKDHFHYNEILHGIKQF